MRLAAAGTLAALTSPHALAEPTPDGLPPHTRPDCDRVFFPLEARPGHAPTAEKWWRVAEQSLQQGDRHRAYGALWRTHHADPSDARARRALGLPGDRAVEVTSQRGRAAPAILRWRVGRYRTWNTPHFAVHSTADPESSAAIARRLERFYWIWTQVFFPLWQDQTKVAPAIAGRGALASGPERLNVVLFTDRDQYNDELAQHVPGIEQSSGFYSDRQRCIFLFAGPAADPATWYHELTHQLLREATRCGLPARTVPGASDGFWLVEGIASYMESVRIGATYALVGGWESPRLQFARYRAFATGDAMPLAELAVAGRAEVRRRDDLPRWYAHAATYTHLLMDTPVAGGRDAIFAKLQPMYAIDLPRDRQPPQGKIDHAEATRHVEAFLRLNDKRLYTPDPAIPIESICLHRTEVTPAGLRKIAPQTHLRWLDLGHLPVEESQVQAIVAKAGKLKQLNLEGTRVGDGIGDLLAEANRLQELDLSFTPVATAPGRLHPEAPIETLFLTGTQLDRTTAAKLLQRDSLKQFDLQRTRVSDQEAAELQRQFPGVRVNPLRLIPPRTE